MSKISELSDGGSLQSTDYLIAVRSGGNVKVQPNGTVTGTTGSFSGNVTFADNAKAIFGAGSDLQIYHTGAHSYIDDTGTGNLYLNSNGAGTIITGASETQAQFFTNGAVNLFYDNSQKLATTATGIDVTGTVTADGLTVQKNGDIAQFTNGSRSAYFAADSGGFSLFTGAGQTGNGLYASEAGTYAAIYTNSSEKVRITSAGNVGIGTTSPITSFTLGSGTTGVSFQSASSTFNSGKIAVVKPVEVGSGNGHLVFETYGGGAGGGERMRLDSAGNVGIGVTPSAWESTSKAIQFGDLGYVARGSSGQTMVGYNNYLNTSNQYIYSATSQASRYEQISGEHRFFTAPSGTAGNAISFTQAMTLDASGNVGIGTTSPSSRLHVDSGTAASMARFTTDDAHGGYIFWDFPTGGGGGYIGDSYHLITGTPTDDYFTMRGETGIDFSISSTRAMRIASGGNIVFGSTGSIAADANKCFIEPTTTEGGRYTAVGNNSSGGALFLGARSDTTNATILVRPDGDLENANNSYGSLSDQRLKQDIADAASQWDDIKAMRVRKYRFKSDPDAPLQIGLVAQELEETSPGLVKSVEDDINYGNIEGPVKTVRYSVVYMKAIKALQEAMARIETLEAEVAALKGA